MKKRYSNLYDENELSTMRDVIKWQQERRTKRKVIDYTVPQCDKQDLRFLRSNTTKQTITWIGHATFLIQQDGLTMLTDPVWANYMGTVKRLTAPGIRLEQLPAIDVVLLSHAHYDHFHARTLKEIQRRNPNVLFLVPAGLAYLMQRHRLRRFVEMEWYDTYTHKGVPIHFVPAKHWTRRMPWDTNTSHWGGFVIEASDEKHIYFAGDSGYFKGFADIGARFHIHTAIMPIGAYEPEWFMKSAHVTPEEAVQAFHDVGAHVFIPMHYGSFMLADDTPKEALDRLYAAWDENAQLNATIRVLVHGETLL